MARSSNGLSGKLLPIHFKPEDDELLSSWICRLALAHGVDSASFCSSVLGQKRPKTVVRMDAIDTRPGEEFLILLAQKTDTQITRVEATTLPAYAGFLFERWNPSVARKWTLAFTLLPGKTQYGLQYCPLCLAEEEPYYRRLWRLSIITLCTKHGVQLLDRCPRCKAPVYFHKATSNGLNRVPSDRITFCHSCGYDLRNIGSKLAGSIRPPSDDELSFQCRVEKALLDGWIKISGVGAVHSLLYFPVLHRLMKLLILGDLGRNLRRSLSRRYSIEMGNDNLLSNRHLLIHLAVGERRQLLEMSRHLLDNWPCDFADFCTTNKIPKLYLLGRNEQTTPFWFWAVVSQHVRYRVYEPPRKEIESAILYLKKIRGQYPRRPCHSPKEMKVIKDFLAVSPRYRELLKAHRIQKARRAKQERPRRMSETLWKKVEVVINSSLKVSKLEPSERRKLLDGIFYVLVTGCSWEAMPAKFGSHISARSMYYDWKRKGLFEQLWKMCSGLYGE